MKKTTNTQERLVAYKRAYDLIKCRAAQHMCNTLLEMVNIEPSLDSMVAVFETREEKYKTIGKLFPEFDLFYPDESRPSTWFPFWSGWSEIETLEVRLTILEFCIGMIEIDLENKERLEYLRGELQAERISYGELAELQSLAPYIDKGDVELLEAAGVPEN